MSDEEKIAIYLNGQRFERPRPRFEIYPDTKRFSVIINESGSGELLSFRHGDVIDVELSTMIGTYQLVGKFVTDGEFTGVVEGDIPDDIRPI